MEQDRGKSSPFTWKDSNEALSELCSGIIGKRGRLLRVRFNDTAAQRMMHKHAHWLEELDSEALR